MKNEENDLQTDRNEILKVCTLLDRTMQFFTPKPSALSKEYQPRVIRSPTDHDIRNQENPEQNENQQDPGIDKLTSDVKIRVGEESVKRITNFFLIRS